MPFRLLPLLIVACIVMFGLKIADIIDRRQSVSGDFLVTSIRAEEKAEPEAEAEKPAEEAETTEEKEENSEGGEETAEDEKKPEGETAAPAEEAEKPEEAKAPGFSETELEILQRLAKRREGLDQRESELNVKENVLNLTQSKIDEKLKELRGLKSEVEKLLAEYGQKEDERIQSLVKIYEGMKPKDAAAIFGELDINTLLLVISKMKEAKSAPVIAEMDPKRAKELTELFVEQRKISGLGTTASKNP